MAERSPRCQPTSGASGTTGRFLTSGRAPGELSVQVTPILLYFFFFFFYYYYLFFASLASTVLPALCSSSSSSSIRELQVGAKCATNRSAIFLRDLIVTPADPRRDVLVSFDAKRRVSTIAFRRRGDRKRLFSALYRSLFRECNAAFRNDLARDARGRYRVVAISASSLFQRTQNARIRRRLLSRDAKVIFAHLPHDLNEIIPVSIPVP